MFSKDSFLVTLDIDSIYTNIGIDAGINSVKRAFDRYPDSDKNIIDLLELSLKEMILRNVSTSVWLCYGKTL